MINIVILSEAKNLNTLIRQKILRRFTPQNDRVPAHNLRITVEQRIDIIRKPLRFDILNEMDYFISPVTEQEIKKEKQKARDLRKTQWWKRNCAQGKCYYCGADMPPREVTMDHIVPIIRGGKTTKNNVVTACKECNNKKKHSLLIEWEEYVERIKKHP